MPSPRGGIGRGLRFFLESNFAWFFLDDVVEGADVVLTMVDGKVLYKDGEYLTLDIEKVKYNAKTSAYRIAGEF